MFFTKMWRTSIFFLLSRERVCTKLSRGYESPQMSPKPGLQIPLQACFRQPELREAGLKLWHPENGNLPDWVCLHSAAQSCAWCSVTFLDTASRASIVKMKVFSASCAAGPAQMILKC